MTKIGEYQFQYGTYKVQCELHDKTPGEPQKQWLTVDVIYPKPPTPLNSALGDSFRNQALNHFGLSKEHTCVTVSWCLSREYADYDKVLAEEFHANIQKATEMRGENPIIDTLLEMMDEKD